jgi:anti-sigma-K factor RskA
MSSPDNKSHFEELAALHAVDLLDDTARKELLDAARRDPEIQALLREFAETAALLADEAPQIEPPPKLKQAILDQLPAQRTTAKIIAFPQWIPYAIAACLMILGISQVQQITALKSQLASVREDANKLRDSNALTGLRLATLEAKDASYASSKILVAWDPYRHQGVVTLNDLPAAPAGHDYQLWVLDPAAEAPISAGLVKDSRSFSIKPVSTSNPGFAISLEPTGGSPEPTGPILFAVAPGV